MRIFIKTFIFIFAVQANKNIAAHHQTGFGKYVADDKAQVSVRARYLDNFNGLLVPIIRL